MHSNGLVKLLPNWIRQYQKRSLPHDLSAGLIVSVLALPQSLAYALLAGLPPQAGLYVSILPAIAYALVGSSMVQAVGPVAITAIMTFSVLQPLATPGSAEYVQLAAYLALMSGAMLCLSSFLRLGFLAQLLSRPVVQGFISGAAILIVLSQIRHLLGLDASAGHSLASIYAALSTPSATITQPALIIGLTSLVALVLSRQFLCALLTKARLALNVAEFITRLMPLVVVAFATIAVHFLGLEAQGVAVVGAIKSGLPSFQFFAPNSGIMASLLLPAALLALIGMVQNIAVAQALAIKRRERVNANAEFFGLGASNLVASFYGGMPVGGGVSRSALNVSAGAQTPLATIVAAAGVAIIVTGFASTIASLPLAVLAASIVMAAVSMIDIQSLRTAWAYDRADGLAWLATAGGVVFWGIERGIELGILLSLITILIRASKPHIARLGRIAGTEHFRNVDRHQVETLSSVMFFRIDANLFFGNLGSIEERLANEVSANPAIHDVVLVMSAVNEVDTTAMEMLCDINLSFSENHIKLHLAEIKGPVQDRLLKSMLWPALTGQVFLSANAAYEALNTPPVQT